jgi:hypothetical protein
MWHVPLENSILLQGAPEHYVQNVYEQKSIQDTITYLHACCFSPVQDTWLKAIQNGLFSTWQFVTVENVRKYLPKSDAAAKGHMNQIRQNIRSTQPAPESDIVQEDKCNFIYEAIMETNQIYKYLTGIFPTTSLSGNKYILILYEYDSNSVLSAPMKNEGEKDMVRAFKLLSHYLIIHGLKPSLKRLYNKASLALRNYLKKQVLDYQLAPRHIHRRDNAERVIRTFKNHFISGLCSVDTNFPLKLWDKVLPQATIILKLLRK